MNDFRRRVAHRLGSWDYSLPGYYFVTICTRGKICCFGEVEENRVILSDLGVVLREAWDGIPLHYACVKLDAFVIMPNHVHGIVVIQRSALRCDDALPNLINVVRSFKRVTTKEIRRTMPQFAWQRSFYDHVIRDDDDLNRVREYIINNPLKWRTDEEYVGV